LCRSAAVALIPSGTGPIRPSAFKIEIQVAHESLRNKADAIQCAREQHGDPTRTYLMNHTEETLVLIKPDALERGLAGEIIRRFEAAGLRIHNVRWVSPSLALVEKHYADLKSKNPRAFDRNTRYLAKKNAIALVLPGRFAVTSARIRSSLLILRIEGCIIWSMRPTLPIPPEGRSSSGLGKPVQFTRRRPSEVQRRIRRHVTLRFLEAHTWKSASHALP